MINFVAGIAIGAAFSPFWVKLFNYAKSKFIKSSTTTGA